MFPVVVAQTLRRCNCRFTERIVNFRKEKQVSREGAANNSIAKRSVDDIRIQRKFAAGREREHGASRVFPALTAATTGSTRPVPNIQTQVRFTFELSKLEISAAVRKSDSRRDPGWSRANRSQFEVSGRGGKHRARSRTPARPHTSMGPGTSCTLRGVTATGVREKWAPN